MAEPRRILIVGVNWLGDALMMTPAIRAVRRAYPNAYLECLIPRRVHGVFCRNPHLNHVRIYEDRASIASPYFWQTLLGLRTGKFDLAVLFHGSKTKSRLAAWAGIPEQWQIETPLAGGVHRAQTYLDLLMSRGVSEAGKDLEFIPDPQSEKSLDELLRQHQVDGGRPFFAVHAGGNWNMKRWPVAHFRTWLQLALQAYPSARAVFCGSSGELSLAEEMAKGFDGSRIAVLAGKTSLDELAVLFRKALFVLSNDSGPIHLAASQGARIVGLYGPTSPAQTGPWTQAPHEILWKDPGCEIPCYFRTCDNRVCLDRLTPENVLQACRRVTGTS